MEPIKVLYLTGGFPSKDDPSKGIFHFRSVKGLSEYCDITVIHFRILKPGRKIYEEEDQKEFKKITLSVPFVPLGSPFFQNLKVWIFRFFLTRYCKEALNLSELVHCGDANFAFCSTPLKNRFGFKVLAQCIGGDLNEDFPLIEKEKWFIDSLKNVDFWAFNSKLLLEGFDRKYPYVKSNKRVVYRGVDIERFKSSNDVKKSFQFYFLGGFPNYKNSKFGNNLKGGGDLLRAWELFEKEVEDPKVNLAIAGPESLSPEIASWKESLKNPKRVELFGKIDPDEIPGFHSKGKVLILPSRSEGLPNVLLEALASGNDVIATDVGGIPEILNAVNRGSMIQAADPNQLMNSMKNVLNSLEEKKNNVQSAIEKFHSEHFTKSYLEIYEFLKSEEG